jgi:hypothetical protein
MGANMLGLFELFRSLAARSARMRGPYVSGRERMAGSVAPATIRPTQNVQRQPLTGEMKPATMGAMRGPTHVP